MIFEFSHLILNFFRQRERERSEKKQKIILK
jgi:hypothetical protein